MNDLIFEPDYIPLEWIDFETEDEQLIELEEKIDEISLFKALAEYIGEPHVNKEEKEKKKEKKKEKERKQKKLQKDLKRSRDMGMSLEEYNKLDISIRDKRKRARKSDVFPPIKGVNFSYPEGISLIFKDNNFLTKTQIIAIGKKRGYWSHKLQRTIDGKCQISASISLTLRKMVIKKKLGFTSSHYYRS